MVKDGNRFERLLRLISILQRTPGLKAPELSMQMGVSERSIFRDLKTLKAAGIPIERAEDGEGYRLGDALRLPRLELTPTEARAFEMLPRLMRDLIDQPQMRSALSALNKVRSAIRGQEMAGDGGGGGGGGKQSAARVGGLDYVSARQPDVGIVDRDGQWFSLLSEAIEDRRLCRIFYQGAGGAAELELPFEPRHLHFWNRAWYTIGFCRQHQSMRMLKLTRIKSIDLCAEGFSVDQPFSIDAYLKNAWGLQASAEEVRVVVLFSPRVARNVREVQWHPTQQGITLGDGCLQLEFRVAGIDEIAWWIAGYADQALVLEPVRLRTLLRDRSERLRTFYDRDADPRTTWAAAVRSATRASATAGKAKAARRREVGDINVRPLKDLLIQPRQIRDKTTP